MFHHETRRLMLVNGTLGNGSDKVAEWVIGGWQRQHGCQVAGVSTQLSWTFRLMFRCWFLWFVDVSIGLCLDCVTQHEDVC